MKLNICSIVIVLLLTGCAQVYNRLPSVENCQHVALIRDYSVTKIYAECDTSKPGTVK